MLLPYRVKVSDTKVTHFTPILALCTCLYRSHLGEPVSMKQTKHSRKLEAQNLCSKCPSFTRTHAFKRLHHCAIAAAMTCGPAASTPSADVLSTPSHHESASGRPSLEVCVKRGSTASGICPRCFSPPDSNLAN